MIAASLRAFQLDRAGNLKEPQALAEAVVAAMRNTDCLLLSYEQLCLPGFPIQLFRCAIEYACQAAMDQKAALTAANLLKQRARLYWVAFVMHDKDTGSRALSHPGQQSEEAPHPVKAENVDTDVAPNRGLQATQRWYEQIDRTRAPAAADLPLPAKTSPLPDFSDEQESGEKAILSPKCALQRSLLSGQCKQQE